MNESFYFHMIKNWLKASLVLHTRQLKEDNGRTKTDADRYRVREGSPVGRRVSVVGRTESCLDPLVS